MCPAICFGLMLFFYIWDHIRESHVRSLPVVPNITLLIIQLFADGRGLYGGRGCGRGQGRGRGFHERPCNHRGRVNHESDEVGSSLADQIGLTTQRLPHQVLHLLLSTIPLEMCLLCLLVSLIC